MFVAFPNRRITLTFKKHYEDAMRYFDNEMYYEERKKFEFHLGECVFCNQLLSNFLAINAIINSMKLAVLPETVWDNYWNKIRDKIGRKAY